MKDGYIEVPKKLGLGIELNEKAFEKFSYKEGPMAIPGGEKPSIKS